MGYFITFEGVEGSGKSTQIKMLAERLIAHDFPIVLTREPGGCAIADKIRTILLDADNSDMAPLTELLLYSAARAQHVNQVITPAMASGAVVLCDRYCDATVAYQSHGRGIDRQLIDSLNRMACQGMTPDLTVLIDCAPELGLERARRRIEAATGPREERFELETVAFHQRVREGYRQLAEIGAHRFIVVDGNDTLDSISDQIAVQVLARLPEELRAIQ